MRMTAGSRERGGMVWEGRRHQQGTEQACGSSQFVVSLQSKPLLSVIDKGPAALCDAGLVI